MKLYSSKLEHLNSSIIDLSEYDKIYLADDTNLQCSIIKHLFPQFIVFNPATNKNLMELNDLLENYIKINSYR